MPWIVEQMGAGPSLEVADDGEILRRLDMPDFKLSGRWRFSGIYETRGGHLKFKTASLDAMPAGDLRFKNGKPRYFVLDNDHGTARVQMCGISRVYKRR